MNRDLDDWRRRLVVSDETQIEFSNYSVSESAVSFANELAELCDKNGISAFEGGFRVRDRGRIDQQEITRDLVIRYSAIDGRGRPRRQLSVSSEARVTLKIDNEPDTSN